MCSFLPPTPNPVTINTAIPSYVSAKYFPIYQFIAKSRKRQVTSPCRKPQRSGSREDTLLPGPDPGWNEAWAPCTVEPQSCAQTLRCRADSLRHLSWNLMRRERTSEHSEGSECKFRLPFASNANNFCGFFAQGSFL